MATGRSLASQFQGLSLDNVGSMASGTAHDVACS